MSARSLRYKDFADRIDYDALYADLGWEPTEVIGSEDKGYCLDPWNMHKHGDTTGKLAINRDKGVYNCVSKSTMIHTDQGLRVAANLVGKEVNVLTEDGAYRPAKWYSYGYQRLYEVVLENGDSIFATEGHEWVVSRSGNARWGNPKRVTTLNLLGERIPMQPGISVELDISEWEAGVRHGLVYGDGTADKRGYCKIEQFGEENYWLLFRFFRWARDIPNERMKQARVTREVGRGLKRLPPLTQSRSYLTGFLAGLLAADGHIAKNGSCVIHQADRAALESIRLIAAACGVPSSPPKMERTTNPWTGDYAPIYRLQLSKTAIRQQADDLVLKESHTRNLAVSGPTRNRITVKVVDVRDTGRTDEVVCCVEPVTHTMTVGQGYLTGQCWVCGGGTILSLVMEVKSLDIEDATAYLWQFAGQDKTTPQEFYQKIARLLEQEPPKEKPLPYFNTKVVEQWVANDHPWFAERNISDDVREYFKLGFNPTARTFKPGMGNYEGPAIILPHFWQDKLVGWQNRWLDEERPRWVKKYTNTTDFPREETLWGYDFSAGQPEPPIVVESVATALFLLSEGYPAIATLGSQITPTQLRYLRTFQSGVLLARDNDPAGEKWLQIATNYLHRYIKVLHVPPVIGESADLGDLSPEELSTHLKGTTHGFPQVSEG